MLREKYDGTLDVVSIFDTIDGEVNGFMGAGEFSTFIRFMGCTLRCNWCDTSYSTYNHDSEIQGDKSTYYTRMTPADICAKVRYPKVTLTGGDPFDQPYPGIAELIYTLVSDGRRVSIETGGHKPLPKNLISNLKTKIIGYEKSPSVRFIYDYKLPSSGMEGRMKPINFAGLTKFDVVKFVIANADDYDRAKEVIFSFEELKFCKKAFGVVYPPNEGAKLAGSIYIRQLSGLIKDIHFDMVTDAFKGHNIIINTQLHKLIYPETVNTRIEV